MYKYVVLSAGTKVVPRALCLISHIPRRLQASCNIFWIALDNTFLNALISTAEGTSRGKSATKNVAAATRVENAGKKNELFYFILFYFILICAAIKKVACCACVVTLLPFHFGRHTYPTSPDCSIDRFVWPMLS